MAEQDDEAAVPSTSSSTSTLRCWRGEERREACEAAPDKPSYSGYEDPRTTLRFGSCKRRGDPVVARVAPAAKVCPRKCRPADKCGVSSCRLSICQRPLSGPRGRTGSQRRRGAAEHEDTHSRVGWSCSLGCQQQQRVCLRDHISGESQRSAAAEEAGGPELRRGKGRT